MHWIKFPGALYLSLWFLSLWFLSFFRPIACQRAASATTSTTSISVHLRLSVVPFFVFMLVPSFEICRAKDPLCHTETHVIDHQILTKGRKALQYNNLRAFVTRCGAITCDTVWPVHVLLF